jgi:hypothetical protein
MQRYVLVTLTGSTHDAASVLFGLEHADAPAELQSFI